MSESHVMLDLESFGTKVDSQLISIGIVRFNKKGISDKKEIILDVTTQPERKFDFGTLAWWVESPKKSKVLHSYLQSKHKVSLNQGLVQLSNYITPDDVVWANGMLFDLAALINAYNSFDMPLPWNFRNVRCMRGMRALFGDIELEFKGDRHSAVDDCVYQAEYVIACWKKFDSMKGIQ